MKKKFFEGEEEVVKKVEGYIKGDVFVVTGDPHGLLTKPGPEPTQKEYQDVKELLKKYRPKFDLQ